MKCIVDEKSQSHAMRACRGGVPAEAPLEVVRIWLLGDLGDFRVSVINIICIWYHRKTQNLQYYYF